jgi:hypothetical protein
LHDTVLPACGNVRLLEIAESLRDSAELYRRWSVPIGGEYQRDVAGEHRALFDLLRLAARRRRPGTSRSTSRTPHLRCSRTPLTEERSTTTSLFVTGASSGAASGIVLNQAFLRACNLRGVRRTLAGRRQGRPGMAHYCASKDAPQRRREQRVGVKGLDAGVHRRPPLIGSAVRACVSGPSIRACLPPGGIPMRRA